MTDFRGILSQSRMPPPAARKTLLRVPVLLANGTVHMLRFQGWLKFQFRLFIDLRRNSYAAELDLRHHDTCDQRVTGARRRRLARGRARSADRTALRSVSAVTVTLVLRAREPDGNAAAMKQGGLGRGGEQR